MKKMGELFFISILFTTFAASTGSQLAITHKPSYVSLADNVDTIPLSDVQHILAAVHGFTLHKELDFKGLYASSPFQHPKSSAVVTLYGGDEFIKQLEQPKISLKVDDVYFSSHSLRHNLEYFFHKDSNIVEIDHESKVNDFSGALEGMSDSTQSVLSIIGGVYKLNLLNATEPEIFQLLRQASLMLQSIDKVSEHGAGLGDFYSFELFVPTSESTAVNVEMFELLGALLEKVNSKMGELYGEDYVVLALSLPGANVVKSRKSRSLMAVPDYSGDAFATNINLATAYDADYPVMFHIILWLVVFMALLVIFVTYGLMTSDLGNDSIIYRMTATKIKKDN